MFENRLQVDIWRWNQLTLVLHGRRAVPAQIAPFSKPRVWAGSRFARRGMWSEQGLSPDLPWVVLFINLETEQQKVRSAKHGFQSKMWIIQEDFFWFFEGKDGRWDPKTFESTETAQDPMVYWKSHNSRSFTKRTDLQGPSGLIRCGSHSQ